jgi:hypothetical protein
MSFRVQIRRDPSGKWIVNNPILLSGEIGYETDTTFLKIGDGATTWNNLPYWKGGQGPVGPTGASGATYKVFTALLTQSGTNDPQNIGSEDIIVGATYKIVDNTNLDVTNIGAPNNNINTYFIATGTTPALPGVGLCFIYDPGAPVVNVLENTIGNVYFTYNQTGQYDINSGGLFSTDKTTGNNAIFYDGGVDSLCAMFMSDFSVNSITMYSTKNLGGSGTYYDSLFSNVFIEIRVYN